MRRIVSCSQCKRQYDASRYEIGARCRCRCGEVITIEESRGNDAEVIRCSACGGPRAPGNDSCVHCGDTFTLHEKDLHTVCPECMTRVSDRARFCHNCATPLRPEEEMGPATDAACPACGQEHHLHSRTLGNKSISSLECDRCAGLWLGGESFEELADTAVRTDVSLVRREPDQAVPESHSQDRLYRRCPFCDRFMNRSNYGMRSARGVASGVIVDICGDHGVWFDCRELENILSWVRSGGVRQDVPRRPRTAASFQRVSRSRRSSAGNEGFDLANLSLEGLVKSGGQRLGAAIGSLFDIR